MVALADGVTVELVIRQSGRVIAQIPLHSACGSAQLTGMDLPSPAPAATSGDRFAPALDAYERELVRVLGRQVNARKARVRLETLAKSRAWTDPRMVDRAAIVEALNDLAAAGRKPKTVETLTSQLHSFFEWAVAEGWATVNPCVGLRRGRRTPRGPSRRRGARPLTDAEFEAILAAARADECSSSPRCTKPRSSLYLLLRYTGARRGQIERTTRLFAQDGRIDRVQWGLRWRDVDLEAGTITLDAEDAKTGKGACLPLHAIALEELRRMRATRSDEPPESFVFPWKLHDRVWYGDLRTAGVKARGSCGRSASIHGLRKAFAYGLVRSGCDVNVARRLLQHATLEMTLGVYDEVRQEDLAAGLEKMLCGPKTSEPKDLGGGKPGASEIGSLTGKERTDSVGYRPMAQHPVNFGSTPRPGPLGLPGAGTSASLEDPRGIDPNVLRPLAASSVEGEPPFTLSPASRAMPRGGLEPPFASEVGGLAAGLSPERSAKVADLLEAIARLLREEPRHG